MAIDIATFSVTMTDAEFLLLNGRAATAGLEGAGILPQYSVFYNLNDNGGMPGQAPLNSITASSTTGTTTVTISANRRTYKRVSTMLRRLWRAAEENKLVNSL